MTQRLVRLQLHTENTRVQGSINYIGAFLFGYSGQSCFKTSDASRSPTREAVLSYTQARLHSHMRVHTNQYTGKRRDSQEDLQQKRGSRAGAGTKVSSSPSDPQIRTGTFAGKRFPREHGWIYDYVLRILDRQLTARFLNVLLTISHSWCSCHVLAPVSVDKC
ncbi:hypothetical protein Q8A67_021515 [Cirrhinus molitorella]|uniref:Uncharacterized protein n=1 Tax=Cirrhinus molitorella TaxID=172907 RepID=A0AA88TG60_9TELE|nr:hypothetical protein Q8A67_021515 [Cirrhinus molitorella]